MVRASRPDVADAPVLGPAGIPALGLGTWQLTGAQGEAVVRRALELGYRHLDTAAGYDNEREVGRAIRGAGLPRDALFVTTKLAGESLRPERVGPALTASRERLGLERVDLLLIHWPSRDVPVAETLAAMLEERARGAVRHIGVSNFPSDRVREAARHPAAIACDQVEYHPFLAQRRLLACLRSAGIPLVAYRPLARGRVLRDPVLREIAAAHRCSPASVALRWLLQQRGVGAVPKATRREHLEANLQALSIALERGEMRRIWALARGERLIDPDFAPVWDASA